MANVRALAILLCASSSLAVAAPAAAQTAATGESDTTLVGELIVTAQKREQALIDVPLSVTAIRGEELEKRGAGSIEDLQYSVPGMSITEFSPGQQRVQLRGVSVYSGLPTVGSYLDELPLNLELNQSGQDVRLLDMSRIEVLRGPQGTLYGQGALGGTIRYITNDPDLDDFSVSADGEVGAIDDGGADWKLSGVLNTPLAEDKAGLRLAASYQNFGGWIDNPLLGEENVNGGHALTLRGKLAVRLTDQFKISLLVQHQDLELGALNLSDANQQVFDRVATPYSSRATLANLIAQYDLGFATLLSSTGYIDRHDKLNYDLTNTLGPFVELIFGFPFGTVEGVATTSNVENRVFTQEMRLASNGSGPFQWTVGGFYRNSQTEANTDSVIIPDIVPPGFDIFAASGTSPDNSRSWALFGEASYDITPELTALVGLRYFEDRRVQETVSTIFGIPAVDQGEATFNALSPRFNLSWQPNRLVNIYANVAKGFRSGGFNITSTGGGAFVPPSYEPDSMWSYEAGGKFQTPDGRFAGELAVYRNEWSDVQTTTNIPGLPTNFTTNGGKIAGWGIDASASWSPIPDLTLTLTGGWNNMAYESDSVEHLAGDPADYVPPFTGSASVEYRFRVADLPSFARVDYQYSDQFQVFVRNFQAVPAFSDEQSILNARIGVSNDNWSATLFARNILNRDSVIYPAFAALIYPARLEPRVIGVSFSFNH